MSEFPMITTWMGKHLEDMTREELIEALEHAVRMMSAFNARGSVRARSLGRVEIMKRGEI